jgi:nucleoid-associated protein YgaU
MILLMSILIVSTVIAQPKTKEEWQRDMTEAVGKRDALQKQSTQLEAEIEALKKEDAAKDEEIKSLDKEILSLAGVENKKELETYVLNLDKIENYLNELSRLSNQELWNRKAELDSVQNMINNAKAAKAANLPQNEPRLKSFQERLDALRASLKKPEEPIQTYTVGTWARDRDCLWNIAKKPAIYENPFLWPKIWQGNKDQIRNPDVIHKGQVLKIPPKAPLTKEENSALRSYWRKKQAAAPKQPAATH